MTGSNVSSLLKKMSHGVLFLWIVLLLQACASEPYYPRYKSIDENTPLEPQGYYQRQLGERTFFVTHFHSWYQEAHGIRVNQEYVLYRAGELTKRFDAKYFEVLFKDDWNFLFHDYRGREQGLPGAGLVIRMLDKNSLTIPREAADHVYEVDKLLEDLAQKNPGLAKYHGRSITVEVAERMPEDSSMRWRSLFDHYKVLGEWTQPTFESSDSASIKEEIKINFDEIGEVIKAPSGEIEVAIRTSNWPSPRTFLLHCATVAEREGFKAFKLENWGVDQHRTKLVFFKTYGLLKPFIEFRTKAHIVFLNQRDPDSFGPVFEVDAIRSALQSDAACVGFPPC